MCIPENIYYYLQRADSIMGVTYKKQDCMDYFEMWHERIDYFQTKEEIFLALLQREHEAWISNLEEITREHETMTIGDFSDAIAGSLEKRGCMLKLMSMNLYDMEGNSRMDNLVAFKVVYAQALRSVSGCLEKFFPQMTPGDIQEFLYVFFPFLFGVYPYTTATDKQKEAMELAHVNYAQYSVYEIVRSFVSRILQTFNKEHH